MPSHKKFGQVGFGRTISANSLTDVATKPLDLSITSQRITKRKSNCKRHILKTLSLRRQKMFKNSKEKFVSSDDESTDSTNVGLSSDTNQEDAQSVRSAER